MSCFICSDRHISALAAYAVRNHLSSPTVYTAAEQALPQDELLARRLSEANVKAFADRYEGRHAEDVEPFHFDRDGAALALCMSPVQVIKSAQCFECQACDGDDWDGSVLCAVVESIIGHAIKRLAGYEDAPWGIPGE